MHEKYRERKPGSTYSLDTLTQTQAEELQRREVLDRMEIRTIEDADVYLSDVRYRKHLSWY